MVIAAKTITARANPNGQRKAMAMATIPVFLSAIKVGSVGLEQRSVQNWMITSISFGKMRITRPTIPHLEIDNNWVENNIRPFAIGRKNWLFAASPRGANASALFYSLILTCKVNNIEPFAYFNYMLNRIRDCKTEEDYRAFGLGAL